MTKRNSLICFILSIAIIAGMCFVTIFGTDENHKGSVRNIAQGLDLKGGVSITYEVVDKNFSKADFEDTFKKLELRAYGVDTEASIYKEGDNKITIEIPDNDNIDAVRDKLGKPGVLQFVTDYDTENAKVWLEGKDIKDAEAGYTKDDNGAIEYVVSLEFHEDAKDVFSEVTGKYIGKQLFIVYDGDVKSAPYIREKLSGGKASIDGMESFEAAEELASWITIGSLKLELKEVSSKVVGAKLGEDAINTSLVAGAIGIAFICIFMVVIYRVPGIAAGLALIAYIAMNLLAINGFDVTLTLPGIAGVILSIGMAVDANVIIFARIKEELGTGVEVKAAIKTGFKKATSAILDGNITTLIAALVLWKMGTGPIQGFAKTLAFGIIISMITAMFVTRGLLYLLYSMGFNKAAMYGAQKERKVIDFIGKRWILLGVSAAIMVIGIVVTLLNGQGVFKDRNSNFNLSVEFQGGVSTSVEFEKHYSIAEFNEKILPELEKVVGDGDVIANEVSGTNEYVIKTKSTVTNEFKNILVDKFGAIPESFGETTVSGSVSEEMIKNSAIAVSIAVACMLIYIFIRFRDIRFASSAILCLVHDVIIVILFYAISWTTVGSTFIACLLTILGYSINASIVVFDRIREKLRASEYTGDLKAIVNSSITDTLTRSIYTSLTTFITVAMLYILGVTAMKEFALPLIVGIVAGAYSSVCVAGSLWYTMTKKRFESGKMRQKYLESLED